MCKTAWVWAVLAIVGAAVGHAAPLNYTDAPGNGYWSSPASWLQNAGYPGGNDPADTATIDQGITTVDLDVPAMGTITVNGGGTLYAARSLTQANTVTVNRGGLVQFDSDGYAKAKYYWNIILNDGGTWYGNLQQQLPLKDVMYGTFQVGQGATATIQHTGSYKSATLAGTITAPASATINLASVYANGVMYLAGDNTGLLANLNLHCSLDWSHEHALGVNGGGVVRVLSDGTVYQYCPVNSANMTLARDLTFAGGGTYNKTHTDVSITYTGQWSLEANLPLVVDTTSTEYGWIYVNGPIVEDATPRKVYVTMSGTRPADGKLVLSNPGNLFSGGLNIDKGQVHLASCGAQGRGPIRLTGGASLILDAQPAGGWSLGSELAGTGTCVVEDGAATHTLNIAGTALSPGYDNATSTLTIGGSLALASSGGTPATLNIDLAGSGSPVVVTNDVLAVTGNLTGLSNTVLNIVLSGASGEDVYGKVFTILTCANDLTGQAFANVIYPAGTHGSVICANGLVQLRIAPLESTAPVLLASPTLLRFAGKVTDPPPAPQTVTVFNAGFGSLQWAATVRQPAPSWLTLSNAIGTDNDSFTVQVSRDGLAEGSYVAWIDVTDPAAEQSPQTVAVALQVLPQTLAATHSFTNQAGRGTHPASVQATVSAITIDLSALPAGTQIRRAILVPHKPGISSTDASAFAPLRLESADAPGQWLPTQGPRYLNFDCTAAAQRALLATGKTLRINVVLWPGWYSGGGQMVRLDVWCDQPVTGTAAVVSGLQASCSEGDTMLTYTEVDQPLTNGVISGAQYTAAMNAINATSEVRYRVYRSSVPIDATTILDAELVDEISPLSGWNTEYDQNTFASRVIPTLPVADMTLAKPGTGIYVRRATSAGNAYYAVSRSVDGQEDLANWIPTYNTSYGAVAETIGTGLVLQWMQAEDAGWPTAYYLVRWECPPTWNMPSNPTNYLVQVPTDGPSPHPVMVVLPGAGGTMEVYPYDFENEMNAITVSMHQIPYDCWSGFHENYGTVRPWGALDGNGGGTIRSYEHKRLRSLIYDYVAKRWEVDLNHVLTCGWSMGGTGTSLWAIRAGDLLAYSVSWVGIHVPSAATGAAMLPYLTSWWAPLGRNCLYEDTGVSVWTYMDNDRWLRDHVATETPFVAFSNGKNDSTCSWRQAWLYAKALQETRRPHVFAWGQDGHGQDVVLPGTLNSWDLGVQIDLNRTLPAFTYCSLDPALGDGGVGSGASAGTLNAYLLWQPQDATDTAGQWAMTCLLIDQAPSAACTVDITPRRCQGFKPRSGVLYRWTDTDLASGAVVAFGAVTTDAYGLVTVPQAAVGKSRNRITIAMQGDVTADGQVDALDLLALASGWGKRLGDEGFDPRCDLTGDASVDVIDLLTLADNWGK